MYEVPLKLLKFECTPFPIVTNNNFPPCSVGLLQPQPEEESPLSCHAPSGLQNREDSFHPAGTWLCVWCCVSEYTGIFKCYMCMVCGCVLYVHSVGLCVHGHQCVPLRQHLQNSGYKSTSIHTCLFNHTSTKKYTHAVLAIVRYISCYMLQSDVIV